MLKHPLGWLIGLAAVWLITIPSNLFWQIPLGSEYVQGLRVDYLIPKLYVSWLVSVIGILGCFLANLHHRHKSTFSPWLLSTLLLSGAVLTIRQSESARSISSFFLLIAWVSAVLAAFSWRTILTHIETHPVFIWCALMVSLLIQTFLGWHQLLAQRSFAPYYWLGEPDVTHWNGIAKGVWFEREIILPYGTTPHPNVLAGFLVVGWWLSWRWLNFSLTASKNPVHQKWLRISWGAVSAAVIGLVIATQSLTGTISLILAGSLIAGEIWQPAPKFKPIWMRVAVALSLLKIIFLPFGMKWLVELLPTLAMDLSWQRRTELFETAKSMWIAHPLWGVGINQFTVWQEHFRAGTEIVRFVQPTHNVFWLLVAETGLVGLALAGLLLMVNQKLAHPKLHQDWAQWSWLLLVPAACLDHFWLTQQVGLMTIVMLWVLSMPIKKN